MAERVVSKNLFNYVLHGEMDEQLLTIEKKMKEMMMSNPESKR